MNSIDFVFFVHFLLSVFFHMNITSFFSGDYCFSIESIFVLIDSIITRITFSQCLKSP